MQLLHHLISIMQRRTSVNDPLLRLIRGRSSRRIHSCQIIRTETRGQAQTSLGIGVVHQILIFNVIATSDHEHYGFLKWIILGNVELSEHNLTRFLGPHLGSVRQLNSERLVSRAAENYAIFRKYVLHIIKEQFCLIFMICTSKIVIL